jgi:hypothetical protein
MAIPWAPPLVKSMAHRPKTIYPALTEQATVFHRWVVGTVFHRWVVGTVFHRWVVGHLLEMT